jgi:hypothetical protein
MFFSFALAFDQQGFNSTQAMDGFDRVFGDCNDKGKCTIPAKYLSMLGGLVYITFAIGTPSPTHHHHLSLSLSFSRDREAEAKHAQLTWILHL